MVAFDDEISINAPPETVWRILSDPTYIPKLYRDVIDIEMDPPGRTHVGQKCRITGRVGDLKIASTVEFTRVVKEKLVEGKGLPGGIFATFRQTVALKRDGWDTKVRVVYDYSVDPAFAAKFPDPELLDRVLEATFRGFALSLKEISELVPLAE